MNLQLRKWIYVNYHLTVFSLTLFWRIKNIYFFSDFESNKSHINYFNITLWNFPTQILISSFLSWNMSKENSFFSWHFGSYYITMFQWLNCSEKSFVNVYKILIHKRINLFSYKTNQDWLSISINLHGNSIKELSLLILNFVWQGKKCRVLLCCSTVVLLSSLTLGVILIFVTNCLYIPTFLAYFRYAKCNVLFYHDDFVFNLNHLPF